MKTAALLSFLCLFIAQAAHAAPFAYITNFLGGSVSVIDTSLNRVTATIAVGEQPQCIAVSPDGKRAYVTNFKGGTVSVIDTGENKVVASVPVGSKPDGVAVAPDGRHVYTANFDGDS